MPLVWVECVLLFVFLSFLLCQIASFSVISAVYDSPHFTEESLAVHLSRGGVFPSGLYCRYELVILLEMAWK